VQPCNARTVTTALPHRSNELDAARARAQVAKRRFHELANTVAGGHHVHAGDVDTALAELNAAQAALKSLTENHDA
jgi:hypothetical protein